MSAIKAESGWRVLSHSPALREGAAHVWRIHIDRADAVEAHWLVLSAEERQRANRFYRASDRTRFVVAHGTLRRILSAYAGMPADALTFCLGAHGKPSLNGVAAHAGLEFNLSHSGSLAVLAVAVSRPIGVDVEQWSESVEHREIADRFFSPAECEALATLGDSTALVMEGFFAAWTRKEAYLKATGHGIARGLHHFDVSLTPGAPARLLADRLDADAPRRWDLVALDVAPGYSGALVVESPLREVVLLDAEAALD